MENKIIGVVNALLWGAGILILLAAAFDVLPIADNLAIFLGISCFIINAVIKKIARSSGCCK
ncbi:MAG: hypothetical protein PHC54_06045 [Candidatus Omnitrophica bacterium]|nr:hypothetical protein [Candidatus Omnitrophota bacterium]MDD5592769.1 hypothetical protein [Candidatus Omnitrophota bacterium]